MDRRGLFVGLVTLDLVYLTTGLPQSNQKIVASDYTVAAGGPATNAAVTFHHLGNQAILVGVVGSHPLKNLILTDLETLGVVLRDLDSTQSEPPPISSIIVTKSTGQRAVISINATKTQVISGLPDVTYSPGVITNNSCILGDVILQGVDIILIDGHQMVVGQELAQLAQANNIPVVIDGGSWKPGFEQVLPLADYAICSANFYPPDCHTSEEVFTYLTALGIPHIAVTYGEQPIEYFARGHKGVLEVPKIHAVDTLGAGDVFHGAFCHYILQNEDFPDALSKAAKIAAYSCQFFGTRCWLENKL